MNARPVAMLAPLVALFLTGCGADCESLCEDAQECSGADQDVDCATECADLEQAARDMGCEDAFEEMVDCIDDLDDICDRVAYDGCTVECS